MILIYPVISFQRSIAGQDVLRAYAGSGLNLLGNNPDPKLLDDLSNELHVTDQTPPAFLVHGTNDSLVSVDNSLAMYSALKKAGVPAEMHLPEKGQHGFGLSLTDPGLSSWPSLMITWLKIRGVLPMVPPVRGNVR
jgi:acetyl esterase/lipase